MFQIDIWKYYTKKQIRQIFNYLNQQIILNNDFFHYTDYQIKKYLNDNTLDLQQRFQRFYLSWINFQNKKRIIQRFNNNNHISYPKIFQNKDRIIIDTFEIDYSNILRDINCHRALNKKIPYSYQILIKKLIKNILIIEIYKNKKISYDINLNDNIIYINQYINETTSKKTKYKIDKLLLKYQKKYPLKYKKCKAHLVVSSNWKDLFLQSTFKQWTSCLNLFVHSSDQHIVYSITNGIKAGNLVAYCILDLQDGKSIDQIMDDNGYHKSMYQQCFWRCSIKRYVNTLNYNNYIFCAEHTSYGTIIQNFITFKYKLFTKLNKWLLQLNTQICQIKNKIQTYKLPYNIYSDLHTFNIDMNGNSIYLFNIDYSTDLTYKQLTKINKLIEYNNKLFSNDIIALLSVFKFFEENKLDNIISEQDKRKYIINTYMLNNHFILNNSLKTKKILNSYK